MTQCSKRPSMKRPASSLAGTPSRSTFSRTEVLPSQPIFNGYEAADPRHFFAVSEVLYASVVLSVARHVLQLFARIFKATTVLAPSTLNFQVFLKQGKSTCAKAFFQFSMYDTCGIHDISLNFNMESDADICKNLYISCGPSGGTAMFQGTVERVTKEPTASVPSTMILVFAPPI